MAKSKDIGTLPPAIFDLNTVSTPVSYQSEAGIDTKGYDPAWDDPEFCKTKSDSDRRGEDERVDRPKPNSESKLEFLPESDGQLTIATREPSNPEDYPTPEAYERARATWEANREAAPVTAEVVEPEPTLADGNELSYEERQDKLHLERKVERAFYEAGRALRELRDRRLYRSTHKTFENYCRDRFGFKRRHPYQLIDAANIVDNLLASEPTNSDQMCANGAQNEMTTNGAQTERGTNGAQGELTTSGAQNQMCPIGAQILPTSERQIRPLAKLEPDRQREVWQQAVTEAGGKVPSGRIVKDIVERMQHVESPPKQPTRAHHLTLEPGGLVEVSCSSNQKIHARLGRIGAVKEKTVDVWLRDVETMMMVKHTLKHHQVEAVPMERAPGLRELCDRFSALRERGLDPFELEVLMLLERSVVLTPREMEGLAWIEGRS